MWWASRACRLLQQQPHLVLDGCPRVQTCSILQPSLHTTKPATMSTPRFAAEERFERELGGMVVEDTCPRCGKEVTRGHKAHLMACGGERPPRQPRAIDREELSVRGEGVQGSLSMAVRRQAGSSQTFAQQSSRSARPIFTNVAAACCPVAACCTELQPHRSAPPAALLPQELTEEERQDAFKRTLARMKKVGRRKESRGRMAWAAQCPGCRGNQAACLFGCL